MSATLTLETGSGVAEGRRFTVAELLMLLHAARQRRSTADPLLTPTTAMLIKAAHPGAGATTVALAIADAAAAQHRRVHVVDLDADSITGPGLATTVELGAVGDGQWRRGTRGEWITIDRPATGSPTGWPDLPAADVVLGDLGHHPLAYARRWVLVCRASLPGLRAAEHHLAAAVTAPIAVAAVGPTRWPALLTGSLGPRLRAVVDADRVVRVPLHRRLEVAGLSGAALPRGVRDAGRTLLSLHDSFREYDGERCDGAHR